MSLLLRAALFLVGAALVALVWFGGRAIPAGRPAKAAATAIAAGGAKENRAQLPAASASGSSHVRVVAEGEIAAPDLGKEPLERLPPRPPLSAAASRGRSGAAPARSSGTDAASSDAKKPDGKLLFHPVATAAGRIEAGGYDILLAGLRPVPPGKSCGDNGASWPCGQFARTAFRAFLRGRAVKCDVPAEAGPVTARCTIGGDDVGRWLIENGWATADGPAYADADQAARKERRGVYGPAPKGP